MQNTNIMMCCQMVSQPIFHEGQVVEYPFILHKAQGLNQSYFNKLIVLIQHFDYCQVD
jgi:hypothetical protein